MANGGEDCGVTSSCKDPSSEVELEKASHLKIKKIRLRINGR